MTTSRSLIAILLVAPFALADIILSINVLYCCVL